MSGLINDLLELSRVDSKGKSFEKVNLDGILSIVEQNLALVIKESNANITSDTLPTVTADPTQMMEIFQNLIANAIKFRSKERPKVEVWASDEGRDWVFAVRDNGIGLNTKYADRIFEMFQRLHNKEEYPGTGIGLAISKKIVERHGGRIWVESDGKNGSTFFFTIPKRT
jgi:light-regulated signal transduction histidine kinase (bacteriophytochrome)